MDSKLTLSLNSQVIDQAKSYAKKNKVSLSRLIESYLSSLGEPQKSNEDITPLVKSLSGVIKIDDGSEMKDSYTEYLVEKYK
ncbi:MAG: DUF6364 family protein [Cyclobacteriaceae bacterium]